MEGVRRADVYYVYIRQGKDFVQIVRRMRKTVAFFGRQGVLIGAGADCRQLNVEIRFVKKWNGFVAIGMGLTHKAKTDNGRMNGFHKNPLISKLF